MNKEHLKAILDSNVPTLVAKCGGRIIASDGQIAAAADCPISAKREKMEEFAARWKAWSESDWEQIEPTEEVHKYRGIFVRFMSDTATIQAAFYRAFAGPTTSGIGPETREEPFLVKENGQLTDVVMATRISPNELSYPLKVKAA